MKKNTEPEVGIKLEGATLRFFEHLVSNNLASLEIDHTSKGQPYATIKQGPKGNKIIVHAQAFVAADDNLVAANQVFIAADDNKSTK